jgi:hypothetical protein
MVLRLYPTFPFHARFAPEYHRVGALRREPRRFVHREPDGIHHVARLRPPLELVPVGNDPEAALLENVRRMTAAIEDEISDLETPAA